MRIGLLLLGARGRIGAALVLLSACGGPPPPVSPGGCPGGGAPWGTTLPAVVVADRASDRADRVTLAPTLQGAGCLGLDENPTWTDEPFDVAASPDGASLYVVLGHAAGYSRGTLRKMRAVDGSLEAELILGEEPSTIALSADGRRAFVTLFRNLAHPRGPWTDDGALVEVDTAAMRIVGQVELCKAALGVAYDEPRQRAWVACPGDGQVAVVAVDPASAPRVDAMLSVDGGALSEPAWLALDGQHAFVSAQTAGEVWVFDQASHALARQLSFGDDAFPQRLAAVPEKGVMLVTLDGQSAVAAIDQQALVRVDTISLPGAHPNAVLLTPGARYALVTDEADLVHPGRLLRVDLAGLLLGTSVVDGEAPLGVFPQAIALLPGP